MRQKLTQKRLERVVSHDSGVRKRLALAMKDRRRGLVDAVALAEGVILVNHRVNRAALHKRANLRHFRGRENGGDSAVYITTLLPLFLILEERLFHGLDFPDLRRAASVARRDSRVRVHGQREITVD